MRLIDADAVIAEQYDIFKKLYGGTAQTLKDHLDIDDDLSIPINAMEEYSKAKQIYFAFTGPDNTEQDFITTDESYDKIKRIIAYQRVERG